MVRVPCLSCMILKFPTAQYFSSIGSSKKASGLDLDKKTLFWRFLHKEFELEKKRVQFQFPGYMWIPDYY